MPPVVEGKPVKHFTVDLKPGTTLGHGAGWAHELVRAGQERFSAVGFPKPKDEEWRFTNFAPLAKVQFQPAERADVSADDVARFGMRDESAVELVFVNGFFSKSLSQLLSLPRGAKVGTLTDAVATDLPAVKQHLGKHVTVERTPFAALNAANLRDGAFVYLPRGTTLELPIHLMFLTTAGASPAATHPRVLVVAEENVEATVVETYAGLGGDGVYYTNAVTEIAIAPDSRVDHCRLQHEGGAGVSHQRDAGDARQGRDVRLPRREPWREALAQRPRLRHERRPCRRHAERAGDLVGRAALRQPYDARPRPPELPEPRTV